MSALIYALVARDNTILAEFTENSGNFTTVTQSILDKIPNSDQRRTYVYDRYLFHYVREDGIVYLCLADESFGRRAPFAFLAQIMKDFKPYKSASKSSIAYALNREFAPVLKRQMAAFNKGSDDALDRARGEIEGVKHVMVENIEKVLQRGEQIDIMVEKAEDLSHESKRFQTSARKLKNRMWWENQKFCLLLFIVIAIIVLIIALVASHAAKKHKKHKSHDTTTTTTTTTTSSPKA
ncbi:uncharacterized protein MONBRDRAFT_37114 [Monosiga brevicollis MX1]|uniref:Uncharacterized protein n=1 Tax=Monosiga brevicollis TaxID=81824 RepID=A9UZP1_MONBE|nr:uncharacterized protein MONBRDRAFT_37114 [Monosiga brevicollis MX1]EDQ89266.1 predicted protein [Monosiga brevicollis MX1]|eukprot:XP_001745842.1 hypothetical protein [Monosiga brevicollis MX1]